MPMSLRVAADYGAAARAFHDASASPLGAPMAFYRLPGGPVMIAGPATPADGYVMLPVAPDEAAVGARRTAGPAHGGRDRRAPGAPVCARGRYGADRRNSDSDGPGCYVGSLVR